MRDGETAWWKFSGFYVGILRDGTIGCNSRAMSAHVLYSVAEVEARSSASIAHEYIDSVRQSKWWGHAGFRSGCPLCSFVQWFECLCVGTFECAPCRCYDACLANFPR